MRLSMATMTLALLGGLTNTTFADKPKIAVMRFEAQSASVKDKVDQLTAMFCGQLAKLGDFIVLPDIQVRQQQKRLCSELAVCNPADVAPDLGRNLHADWVFVPYVTMEGDFISLTVTVISISTAAQSSGYDVIAKGGIAELYESIPKLVEQAAQDQSLFQPKDGGGVALPTDVQDDLSSAELLAKQGKADAARERANSARKAVADNHVVLQRALAVYETIGDADLALETVSAWLKLASTANLPSRREMLKKQIQIKDNLAEIKRIGEQANKLLAKLQDAFDHKDAEVAWRLYEDLQMLKPDHPGIAAWKAKMASLESPAKRAERLERERTAALVTATLRNLDAAFAKKDVSEAFRLFDELKNLSPGHTSISDWAKRLEKLNPPFVERDNRLILNLGSEVKLELVRIEPGEFMMGSEDGDSDVKPVHRVRITRPFYMGKYEVTQEQWKAVMGDNLSSFKGDLRPVANVSWTDCQDFCGELSSKTAKTVRLPSEAQWEYACRAGSTAKYCFGDSDNSLQQYGWYDGNCEGQTHPAGNKKPNAWGLYDMHGNVWEWCQDWYGEYPANPLTDPRGPSSGEGRAIRGGSWINRPQDCRSAIRLGLMPGFRDLNYGFRVVVPSASASGTP